jgi:hypothetical protein
MRALRTLACLSLMIAAPALAGTIPVIPQGTPYAAARGQLMSKGFRPVPSGNRAETRCSAGRQDVCAAYPETISCSGTGSAPCRFIFNGADGTAVTLVAEGGDVGRLRVTALRRSAGTDVQWQRAGR